MCGPDLDTAFGKRKRNHIYVCACCYEDKKRTEPQGATGLFIMLKGNCVFWGKKEDVKEVYPLVGYQDHLLRGQGTKPVNRWKNLPTPLICSVTRQRGKQLCWVLVLKLSSAVSIRCFLVPKNRPTMTEQWPGRELATIPGGGEVGHTYDT